MRSAGDTVGRVAHGRLLQLLLLVTAACVLGLASPWTQHVEAQLVDVSFTHAGPPLSTLQPGPLLLHLSASGRFEVSDTDYALFVPHATRILTVNVTQTDPSNTTSLALHAPEDASPVALTLAWDPDGGTGAPFSGFSTLEPLVSDAAGPRNNRLLLTSPAGPAEYVFNIVINAPDMLIVAVQPYPVSRAPSRWVANETLDENGLPGPDIEVPSTLPPSVRVAPGSDVFRSDQYAYSIETDFVCTTVNVTVTLRTIDRAVVYEVIDGVPGTPVPLSSSGATRTRKGVTPDTFPIPSDATYDMTYVEASVVSLPMRAQSAPHQFVVSSMLDGIYTYTVTRLEPDVHDVDLFVVDASDLAPGGGGAAAAVQRSKLEFIPGVLQSDEYVLTVPHRIVQAQLSIDFRTDRSVFLQVDTNGSTVAMPPDYTIPPLEELLHPAGGATLVSSRLYPLARGLNTFRFNSIKDGQGAIVVMRQAADVKRIALLAVSTFQSGAVSSAPLLLEPSLGSSVFYHTDDSSRAINVGREVIRFNLTLEYGTAHSVRVDLSESHWHVPPEQLYDAWHQPIPLPADVLNGTELSFELPFGVSILRINSTQDGLYTLRITRLQSDLMSLSLRGIVPSEEGEEALTDDLIPTASPPLVLGNTSEPTVLHVDWRVWSVQVTAEFLTVGSASFDGVPLVSLNASQPFHLQQGFNNVSLRSNIDGTYQLHIIRAPPAIAELHWSPPGAVVTAPPTTEGALHWLERPATFNSSRFNYTATSSFNPFTFAPLIVFASPGDTVSVTHVVLRPNVSTEEGIPPVEGENPSMIEWAFPAQTLLNATVMSPPAVLEPGRNWFVINSSRDGIYRLELVRHPPDVLDFALRASSHIESAVPVQTLQPFDPVVNAYEVDLLYKHLTLGINVTYLTSSSLNVSAVFMPLPLPIVDAEGNVTVVPPHVQVREALGNRTFTAPDFDVPVFPASLLVSVSSSVDGVFLINATRAQPNLVGVVLTPVEVGFLGVPAGTPVTLEPVFAPGHYNYSGGVDFVHETLTLSGREVSAADDSLTIEFWSGDPSLVRSNDTVDPVTNATIVGTDVLVYPEALVWHGLASVPSLPLRVGTNVVRITSANDGQYTFTIRRRDADMILAQVVGYYPASPLHTTIPPLGSVLDSSVWVGAPVELDPPFRRGVLNYTAVLPFKMQLVSSYSAYRTGSNRVVFDYGTRDLLAPPEPNGTVSTTWFQPDHSPAVTTLMWLTTALDGVYRFEVRVAGPDMLDLELAGFADSMGKVERGDVRIFPVAAGQFPHSAPITQPMGAVSGFRAGSMLYVAQVPTSVAFLNLRASWLASNADVRVQCSGVGESLLSNHTWLLPNSTDLFNLTDAAAASGLDNSTLSNSTLPSTNSSRMLYLQPGVTNLCQVRSSNDGMYLLAIARGNLTFAVVDVPRLVYANRTSQPIGVQLRGGYTGWTAPLDLQVNLSSTLGVVAPALLDYSGASGLGSNPLLPSVLLTRTFVLQASSVPAPTRVSLLFGVRGADAWQIDAHVPVSASLSVEPTNTTLLGGFSLRPETVPATVVISSTGTRLVLSHTWTGRPDQNNTLTLSLFASAGRVSPASITLTHTNWDWALPASGGHPAHSFTFDAPEMVTNVSFTWSLTGANDNNHNNAEQYTLPSPFAIAVRGVMTLVIDDAMAGAVGATTPAPNVHYLYANQLSAPMVLRPRGMSAPSVSVRISSPNSGGGNELLLTPPELVWNGWHNPPIYGPGSYTGENGEAQSFTMQSLTGPSIARSFFVEINLQLAPVLNSLTGTMYDDSMHFEPIPPQLFIILPQASLALGPNFPSSLFANEQSASMSMSISASALPNGGVGDLRVVISATSLSGVPVGTVSPPFVTLTTSSSLEAPLHFSYRAPAQAQLVLFSFQIAGSDAPHYGPIAPRNLTVLPLAVVGASGVPLSLHAGGSDQATLTLTSNLLPRQGVEVEVSISTFDLAGQLVTGASAAAISKSKFVVASSAVAAAGSIGAVLRQPFTLTAPAQAGSLELSFSVRGADQSLFHPLIPSRRITVLASSSWLVRGLPTLMHAKATAVLLVGPLRRPLDTVTLTPTTLTPNVGSFTPGGALTFTYDDWAPRNLTFEAPNFATSVQVSWVVGGNTGGAFPAPAPATVNVLARITLNNVPETPSSSLYLKQQSLPLSVSFEIPSASSAGQILYPFTLSFLCSFGDCAVTPSQIVVTSLASVAGASVVVTAPSTMPPTKNVELSASISGGGGQNYFAVVGSPWTIPLQPQSTFSVTGSLDVYSYGTTKLTLTPTSQPSLGTVVAISLPGGSGSGGGGGGGGGHLGTLSVSTLAFGQNMIVPQRFDYNAPFDLPLTPQKLPISLVATVSGGALAPQFVMPTLELNFKGPRIFDACGSANGVLLTGLLDEFATWNGVYTVPVDSLTGLPSNADPDAPVYRRIVGTGAGSGFDEEVFLYYFVPGIDSESSRYPAGWTLGKSLVFAGQTFVYGDASSAGSVPGSESIVEPFGATWSRRSNALSDLVSVPTMSVSCTNDCSVIGTPASIETRVCFANQPLLGTPAPAVPLDSCPLSCARYLPTLVSQCASTPFFALPAVQNVLTPLNSRCQSCNYEYVSRVMASCRIVLVGSDVTLDLLEVMELPSACSCGATFVDFYNRCVRNQPAAPARFKMFADTCGGAGSLLPQPVATITVVDVGATEMTLTWPVAEVAAWPQSILYDVSMCRNCTAGQASEAGAPFELVSGSPFALNSVRVGGLFPDTPYAFRVLSRNGAGVTSAPSPVLLQSTRPLAPAAPESLDYDVPLLEEALGPALSATFRVRFFWSASPNASTSSLDDTVYRLRITPSPSGHDATAPSWLEHESFVAECGPSAVVLECVVGLLRPGSWYRAEVDARSIAANTRWSESSFAIMLLTQRLAPLAPTLLTPESSAVTNRSVTLSWAHVASCGGVKCTDARYELQVQDLGLTYAAGPAPAPGAWTAAGSPVPFPASTPAPSSLPLLLSSTFASAQAGTNYAFQLRALNDMGESSWSASVRISTPGLRPSVLHLPVLSAMGGGVLQAYWNSSGYFFNDGRTPIQAYRFVLTPVSSGLPAVEFRRTADQLVPQQYTDGSSGFVLEMTGLAPNQQYSVRMEVRTGGSGGIIPAQWSGLENSPVTNVFLPPPPPRFVSFVARDPTGSNMAFAPGCTMDLRFDAPADTNSTDLSVQSEVDRLLSWSAPIPATYTGAWSADRTVLTITIHTVTAGAAESSIPTVGLFSVRVVGLLRNEGATSTSLGEEPAALATQVLLGSWVGAAPAPSVAPHLLPFASVPLVAQGSRDVYPLGIVSNNASLLLNSSALTLTVRCANCMLAYPFHPSTAAASSTPPARASSFSISTSYGALASSSPWFNPLLQLSYSPNAPFYGVDALVLTLEGSGSGLTSETFHYPLRITQLNHAPTISVPLRAGAYAVWGSLGAAFDGLVVRDQDSQSHTPVRVLLSSSSSATASFTLVSALPALGASANLFAVGQSGPSFDFTCHYSLLAQLLRSVRFSDPALDADSPAPLHVDVHVDDLGSGIEGAAARTANAVYSFQPTCIGAPAPVLQQVRLSDDLSSVLVLFDGAVKMAFPVGITPTSHPLSTSSCALYVDATTLTALGEGSTCFQSSSSVVTLRMGSGATLRGGSLVTLNPVSSLVRRCSSALLFASGSLALQAPLSPVRPLVVVQSPSVVGACQDLVMKALVLDVSVASGARYEWNAEVIDGAGVASPAPALLGPSPPPTGDSVTVPAALLLADTKYRFTVVALTALGVRSLPASVEVSKSARVLPSATPLTPLLVRANHLLPLNLVALVSLPNECLATLRPDQRQLVYRWSSSDSSLALDASSASTRSLFLPARSMQADRVYQLTFDTHLSHEPSALSSLTFTVRTQPATVAVVPTRSSMVVPLGAAFQVPLQQPVPALFDPAGAPPLPQVSWTCTKMQDDSASVPCVHAGTNLPLGSMATAGTGALSVAAGSLARGRHTFTAHASVSDPEVLVPLAVVVVTVAPTSRFPTVRISTSTTLVGIDSPLVLESQLYGSDGVALNATSLRSGSYAYEWGVSGPFGPSFADGAVTTGATSPVLSVNTAGKPVLPPGPTLLFRVRVTDRVSGESGMAETSVRVRTAPVQGSFVVEPPSGTAGVTLFRVSAVGWTSGSGGGAASLRYDYALLNWLDGRALPFGSSIGSPFDADTVLNPGNPASSAGYSVTLRLTVTDVLLGAKRTVFAPVMVYPNVSLQGTGAQAVVARDSLRTLQTQAPSNAQSTAQALSVLNAHASLAAIQSSNLTAGATLLTHVFPRCNPNSVPLSSSARWMAPALTTNSNTFAYANGGSNSDGAGAAGIQAAQLAASHAAALSSARSLVASARPFLDTASSGEFSAGALVAGVDVSAPVQSLRLCIHLSNNAAVAASVDLIGSRAQADTLVGMCATTLQKALDTSDQLCAHGRGLVDASTCSENQVAVLSDIMTAVVSLMHLQAESVPATSPSSPIPGVASFERALFIGMVVRALDSMSTDGALRLSGQEVSLHDCYVQAGVVRHMGSQQASYTFGQQGNGGSSGSVTYPPMWLASTQAGGVQLSTAVLNDTLVDSRFIYELASGPDTSTLLSGVLSASRTLAPLAPAIALGVNDAPIIIRMPYDVVACNGITCSPQCALWDKDLSRWQPAVTMTLGTISTRLLSAPGVVECVVSRSSEPVVAVVPGPPVAPPPPTSSTGAAGGGGGSAIPSSTGSGGPSDSSTGGAAEPLCPTCYGPLGGPPPPHSELPDPSSQAWSVNATLVLSLPSSMISPALGAGLRLDLATSASIELARVQLYRMSAGSIIASFYIHPSSIGAGSSPDVAFARLVAASADPSSGLNAGGVSRFGLNLTMANYFPATHCHDGSYALVCPLPSSTGGDANSTSSDSSSSTGTAGNIVGGGGGGSSSSFFVEGTNLIVFIVVLAVGVPLLALLLWLIVWAWRRHQVQAKKDAEMLEEAQTALAKQAPPPPLPPVEPEPEPEPEPAPTSFLSNGLVRVPLPAVVPKPRFGFGAASGQQGRPGALPPHSSRSPAAANSSAAGVDPSGLRLAFPASARSHYNNNNNDGGQYNGGGGGISSHYTYSSGGGGGDNGGGGYNNQSYDGGYNDAYSNDAAGGYNNDAGGGGPAQSDQGYPNSGYAENDAYANSNNNQQANSSGYGNSSPLNPSASPLSSPSAQALPSGSVPFSPSNSKPLSPLSPPSPFQSQAQGRTAGLSPLAFKPRAAPLANTAANASPPPRSLANPTGALANPAPSTGGSTARVLGNPGAAAAAAPSRVLGNPAVAAAASAGGESAPAAVSSGGALGNPVGSARLGGASAGSLRPPLTLGSSAGGALSNPPSSVSSSAVGVAAPAAGGAGALSAPRARSNLRARLKLTSSLLAPPPVEGDAGGPL